MSKMKQLLKIGFLAAVLTLLTIGLNAQALPSTTNPPGDASYTMFTAPDTPESIDSVTVGSRMPYKVTPQTAITGLTFEYQWLFSPSLTVQDLDGTNLTNKGSNYYDESEISVVMPATTGNITLTSNVRNLLNGVELCTGVSATNTITVLPRPTITWTAGGITAICDAQDVTIPVTLTGFREFEVAYTVTHYTNYDGTGTETSSSVSYAVISGSDLVIPESAFSANGLYEITVVNITDRISRKSLDMSLVAAQTADLPPDAYKVLLIPAPTTQPVQHIRNVAP